MSFHQTDAFDGARLTVTEPAPDLAIVSGLYELFPDNALIAHSLGGLAKAMQPGSLLIYTNQPWHPQLEMIARALTSHRGGEAWGMHRRTQAEMDQLVAAAGFRKISPFPQPSAYDRSGQTYTILTAHEGVKGTFADVRSNPAFLDFTLERQADTVHLTNAMKDDGGHPGSPGSPSSFQSVANTPNHARHCLARLVRQWQQPERRQCKFGSDVLRVQSSDPNSRRSQSGTER